MLPLVITSIGSAYAAIDAQLDVIDKRLRANELQVAQNNVPELKILINERFDKLENEQKITQGQILSNYKILCKISQGEC